MTPGKLKTIRMALIVVGAAVWAPYLWMKYSLHRPFPVGWVLAVHVPCMFGALGLRIYSWAAGRRPGRAGH